MRFEDDIARRVGMRKASIRVFGAEECVNICRSNRKRLMRSFERQIAGKSFLTLRSGRDRVTKFTCCFQHLASLYHCITTSLFSSSVSMQSHARTD